MTLLIGFLPFAVFAVVDHFASTLLALTLAALTAAALASRDVCARKSLKPLDVGAFLVFGGLALYTLALHATWSLVSVRLCTDAGLLAIVLVSIAVGQPFTLAYAKERVPAVYWSKPQFRAANVRLSALWGGAFALMVLADWGMLHGLPLSAGVGVTLAALAGAAFFTKRAGK